MFQPMYKVVNGPALIKYVGYFVLEIAEEEVNNSITKLGTRSSLLSSLFSMIVRAAAAEQLESFYRNNPSPGSLSQSYCCRLYPRPIL